MLVSGHVREPENRIERAVLMARSRVLLPGHFSANAEILMRVIRPSAAWI